MTRPFGNNGGGLSGGGMMRTVHRSLRSSVRGGAKDPFPNSPTATTTAPNSPIKKSYKTNTPNLLSLSSSSSSVIHPPSPATLPTWHSFSSLDTDWDCVDDLGDFSVFGPTPSVDEVHQAVSAIHHVVDSASFSQTIKDRFGYSSDIDSVDGMTSPTRITSPTRKLNGREMDWFEPSLQLCNSRALSAYGPDKVYDAFHLLQTEPCIQRMVVSLSTDKAVWDAVLNNEVVRELRETLSEAEDSVSENVNGSATEAATNILSRIFDNTKAKIMQIIEKITNLVNELFPEEEEKATTATTGGKDMGLFEDKLRTSFMLSIIVLLIVVVSRARVV